MLTRIALLLNFIIMFSTTYAQENSVITGRVTDKNTHKPLSMVNVYLEGTSIGSATNKEGNFMIKSVPPGMYTLVVSMIGYKTVSMPVDCDAHKEMSVDIVLVSMVLPGREVTVTAEEPKEWKRNLAVFTHTFFGLSEFADDCELVNPEVLDFQKIAKTNTNGNQEEWLIASSDYPLVFINRALGYRVSYAIRRYRVSIRNGNRFEIRTDGSWHGPLEMEGYMWFKSLQAENPCEVEMWEANRLKAYRGSFRHFLWTLAHSRLKEEGFVVRSTATGLRIEGSEICGRDTVENLYYLTFEKLHALKRSFWERWATVTVDYRNERDYIRDFIYDCQKHERPENEMLDRQHYQKGLYQHTRLMLQKRQRIYFTGNGRIVSGTNNVTYDGFWMLAVSAADWLPYDYIYKSN